MKSYEGSLTKLNEKWAVISAGVGILEIEFNSILFPGKYYPLEVGKSIEFEVIEERIEDDVITESRKKYAKILHKKEDMLEHTGDIDIENELTKPGFVERRLNLQKEHNKKWDNIIEEFNQYRDYTKDPMKIEDWLKLNYTIPTRI